MSTKLLTVSHDHDTATLLRSIALRNIQGEIFTCAVTGMSCERHMMHVTQCCLGTLHGFITPQNSRYMSRASSSLHNNMGCHLESIWVGTLGLSSLSIDVIRSHKWAIPHHCLSGEPGEKSDIKEFLCKAIYWRWGWGVYVFLWVASCTLMDLWAKNQTFLYGGYL